MNKKHTLRRGLAKSLTTRGAGSSEREALMEDYRVFFSEFEAKMEEAYDLIMNDPDQEESKDPVMDYWESNADYFGIPEDPDDAANFNWKQAPQALRFVRDKARKVDGAAELIEEAIALFEEFDGARWADQYLEESGQVAY